MERWTSWCNDPKRQDPNGKWVLYDDAQRAVAEAEDRYYDKGFVRGESKGQRDERARIRAAVEALEPIYRAYPHRFVRVSDILAALRALSPDGGE